LRWTHSHNSKAVRVDACSVDGRSSRGTLRDVVDYRRWHIRLSLYHGNGQRTSGWGCCRGMSRLRLSSGLLGSSLSSTASDVDIPAWSAPGSATRSILLCTPISRSFRDDRLRGVQTSVIRILVMVVSRGRMTRFSKLLRRVSLLSSYWLRSSKQLLLLRLLATPIEAASRSHGWRSLSQHIVRRMALRYCIKLAHGGILYRYAIIHAFRTLSGVVVQPTAWLTRWIMAVTAPSATIPIIPSMTTVVVLYRRRDASIRLRSSLRRYLVHRSVVFPRISVLPCLW
jgi:hypothetical protein